MPSAKASFVALLASTPLLLLHCGESSDGGDDDKGGKGQAGEGGEAADGSGGTAGTTTTGGSGGDGGNPATGGSPATGGTAGRGGDAGAPQGGQGDGGDSGAAQGGSEIGGEGGLGGNGDGGLGGSGDGGIGGGGGAGGDPACEDPTGGGPCTGDLSMVGTGDFEVKFTITTSTTANVTTTIQQRGICDHSYFWDARLVSGALYFEVDDANANYVGCQSPASLNDGMPHRVVVRRVAGELTIVVDCGAQMTCPSATNLSMTLAPLGNQNNNPCIGSLDGTVALDGTVSDVCVRTL